MCHGLCHGTLDNSVLIRVESEIGERVGKRDMARFEAVMRALGDVTQAQLRAEAREER
jgi:hypothetical protein